VPEGDTIAYAARRIRPVLKGKVPDEIVARRETKWPKRLGGRVVTGVDTHGKHLFIRFEDGLALHSHLGMVGSWTVLRHDRIGRRAWLVLRVGDRRVVEFDGPLLELMTEGRTRFDRRLAALGPDVLADEFDRDRFLRRLRADDPGRPIGDALLDQTTIAGIGNIWKAEGCWEAQIDPWRRVAEVTDDEAFSLVDAVRPRMMRSAAQGPRTIEPRVYKRTGRPCPRCGTRVVARGQGDANRTTYWCPGCQR
jgi:endonuclease-8